MLRESVSWFFVRMKCADGFLVKPTITWTLVKSRGYKPLLQRADLICVNNVYLWDLP